MISNNSGKYPALNGDGQYPWLVSELKRLAPLRQSAERAVILACHHPPASADLIHGGSTELSADLDAAFAAAGLWPDAIMSGHAHVYQRFSRNVGGRAVPYVVAGSGGHARTLPQGSAQTGQTLGDFTLETGPTLESGYLTLTVDMRDANDKTLTVAFAAPANAAAADTVTVALS